ncbi:MAG TPA: HDIG domain-containing protein [Balneolaceae bacterium]|nr:HDIG domain-containing protein [Balneolaceae bacterium]
MNILEKLGLAPKKHKGAPVIGEKKKKQEQTSSLKYNKYLRGFILFGFVGVLILSVPRASFKDSVNYNIGEPWRVDDLTAPFTFAIQKSEQQIEEEKQTIRETTPAIFNVNNNVEITIDDRLDSLFQGLLPIVESYFQWQQAKQGPNQYAAHDSMEVARLKVQSPLSLSDRSWKALFQNYSAVQAENRSPNTKTAPTDQFIAQSLKNRLEALIDDMLNDGIINVNKGELPAEVIIVRNLQNHTERTVSLANVRDISEARQYARYRLSRNYFEDIANVGIEIFNQVIQPNLIYNEEKTQAHIDEVLAGLSTSKGAIAQGQVIIRRGDIVTQEKYNILQSLAEARSQNASDLERWLRYGGDVLIIIAIVTIFFFYLYLYRRQIFKNNAMLLLVLMAISLICVGSSVVYRFDDISPYIVPVAVAPIILTIIFDSRVGLLSTITLALLTGLITGNNFEYVVATTVACSLGLFSVRDIKKRSQFFFTTPGIVFLSYAAVIIGFSLTTLDGWGALGNDLFFVVINAIFILFTYPLILLFEKTFKVTTDFTLIELSDTNLPLLRELMTKAPGTFHHSLQVSNLAEAAAGAIRANGLLCRVGGLYHDIGKMDNPGYFTENQTEFNEHDKLKPRMSALVIKAHVSNGVKKAEEHGLPQAVIDFIRTHHGTTLIKYFWEKAKARADKNKKEIREEDFRYDGPLPHSKETGILMLADCVEASSRAMKDPNYQKLENLVDKIIDDRVNEGQLSRTPLTFQDLSSIKKTFLNILVGIYHSRVDYPEDDEAEAKEKAKKKADKKAKASGPPLKDGADAEKPVDDYYNS